MTKLCDECETVAHCTKHGCVPKKEFREVYVPDAFDTREGAHPEYIQGWNDCRADLKTAIRAYRYLIIEGENREQNYPVDSSRAS
jgi:hypothetical protein